MGSGATRVGGTGRGIEATGTSSGKTVALVASFLVVGAGSGLAASGMADSPSAMGKPVLGCCGPDSLENGAVVSTPPSSAVIAEAG